MIRQQSIRASHPAVWRFFTIATVSAIALGAWLPSGASADPCIVTDNGTGTITLPPEGCEYLSPTEVHEIIDGLPAGTTIELAPIHKDFICSKRNDIFAACPPPGICEDIGTGTDCFESVLDLNLTGTGDLAGFSRSISVPLFCQIQTQPRTPGDPVQDFDTEMVSCQGLIFGDPDFDLLQIVAGSANGLPSPGHTRLTDLGNGTFQVDSFFDITYTINYAGAPGGVLDGASGSTTATLHMVASGSAVACPLASNFCQPFAADCVGNAGDQCYPSSAIGGAAGAITGIDACSCYNGDDCGPFDVITDATGQITGFRCLPANCPSPDEFCQIHINGDPQGVDFWSASALPPGDVLTCACPEELPPPDPHITLQGTSATFGTLDVPAIPADFFGPNTDPFTGTVNLIGGPTDTLGQRSGPIVCPALGPCDPVGVELVQLDLVSAAPITVTPSLTQWDVRVELSPTAPQVSAILSATLAHANGGTYDTGLIFSPRFTFTEVGNPGNVRVLDFDLEGLQPIEINFVSVDWVVQLGGALVGNILAPSDGNFVPGVRQNIPGDPNSQKLVQPLGLSKGGGIDHPVQQPPVQPPPHPDPHLTLQGTSATFGSPDVPAIPGDFFFPGSPPFVGPVNLVGGPTQTLGQRSGPILCPGAVIPRPCAPVSVELVQLDLVSSAPIAVGGTQWDVAVSLSPTAPASVGTMDATLTHPNGGTYDADIPFSPRFTFTEVGIPGNVRVLDYDLEGLQPIRINFLSVDWVIQIGPLLAGSVDAPNNGNFVPGVRQNDQADPNTQKVIQALGLSKDGGIDHPIQLPTFCQLEENPFGLPPLCAALQTTDCIGSPNDLCLPTVVQTNANGGIEAVECACAPQNGPCGPVEFGPLTGLVSCPGTCAAPDAPPCQLWELNPDGTTTPTGLSGAPPGAFGVGTRLFCDCAPPTEACCFEDGSCSNLTPDDCRGADGAPRGPGTACLGDRNLNGIDDACELDEKCGHCGPGPHWIDFCPAGHDRFPSGAVVGVDTTGDCIVDTNLVMFGTAEVARAAGVPHKIAPTEMVAMKLTGGGAVLRAGAGGGVGPGAPLGASLGAIIEQGGNPALGDSSFGILFELDLGGGVFAYNQAPLALTAVLECVTPNRMYSHPADLCLPLFDSPIPGLGVFVANLVSANHDPLPECTSDLDCPIKCQYCETSTFTCNNLPPEDCCLESDDCADLSTKCRTAVCDLATNQCILPPPPPDCCESDADCADVGSKCREAICDLDVNLCVLEPFDPDCCETDDDCPNQCQFCDTSTNICTSLPPDVCCQTDGDCINKCEICSVTGQCEQFDPDCCETDADCPPDPKCHDSFCNTVDNRCVLIGPFPGCCTDDSDCPPDPKCHDSFCDPATNTCQVDGPFPGCCTDDSECSKCEFCDLATNTCADLPVPCCTSDADCSKCEVCDLTTNVCQQVSTDCCETDSDCPSDGNPCTNELCDPDSNLCVSQPIPGCACQPNDPATACVGDCADATQECRARCVNYDPATGVTHVTNCGCDTPDGTCSVGVGIGGGAAARGPGGNPCVVAFDPFEDPPGTITLPPQGCEYLSPEEVHEIIDGLPAGVTIELAPIHKDFICNKGPQFPGCPPPGFGCETAPDGVNPDLDCFLSTLQLDVVVNGPPPIPAAGYFRTLFPQLACQIETGPRTPGAAVQDFDTNMRSCQGELFGDPDFCTFRITAGTDNGLPSPGHTTLTDLGGGNWSVDSFFDLTYTIEFVGCPGSLLEGMAGTTVRTIRMATGNVEPDCEGVCGLDENCVKTRTPRPDGTVDICCACEPKATGACCVPGALCQVTTATACATLGGVYAGDGTNCDDNDGNGIPDECDPDECVPTDDGSACVGPCPSDGCFGECIGGSYCDDPNCCLIPGNCLCYAPNSKESIQRCGDCFGECIEGAYCDSTDPACCIGGACACYLPNTDISIQLCQDNTCFGFCEGGSYCDGPDLDCAIEFGSPQCYELDSPISIKLCQDPTAPPDDCQPRCITWDPITGVRKIVDCDCAGKGDCHVDLSASDGTGGAASAGPGGSDPCVVANVGGTVTLPPEGCDYLSPDEVHEIINGLPAGVTIELAAIHKDIACGQGGADVRPWCPPSGLCEDDGGDLGGKQDCFESSLSLSIDIRNNGVLIKHSDITMGQVQCAVHSGPRTSGDAVQTFPTEMVHLEGSLPPGDPDFCVLTIVAGRDFGLPCPGETTLTRLGPPGSDFQVDSFFDIAYRIDFQGCPGSVIEGLSGSTIGRIRMGTPKVATCTGVCLPGEICIETKTVDAAGTVTVCCDCQPDAACEPNDDRTACKPFDCEDPNENCQPTRIEVVGICQVTGAPCDTDADCPGPGTCLQRQFVAACDCVQKDVPPTCHWIEGIVAGGFICTGLCDDGVTECHVTTVVGSGGAVHYKCGCDEPTECKPNATGTACEPFVCPGPLPPLDECVASCVTVDPLTGVVRITDCDCRGLNECRALVGSAAGGAPTRGIALGGGGSACVLPENTSGTVTLPPEGCEYVSPDEFHELLDGVPSGVTIEIAAIHKDFVCERQPDGDPGFCPAGLPDPIFGCEKEGGDLGGNVECGTSTIELTILVNGVAGRAQPHFSTLNGVRYLIYTGPHGGGDDVQSFQTEMIAMQGEAPPDALFSLFRVKAGRDFGLPSPGRTTLRRLASGNFAVDSFFDLQYEIEYVGTPGGALDGAAGTTRGTLRMKTGSVPECEGVCADDLGHVCLETVTVNADGTIDKCCECGCPPSSEPTPVSILNSAGGSQVLTTNRFLIFRAGDLGRNQAIRVTLTDLAPTHDIWDGKQLFVGRPGLVSEVAADVVPGAGGSFMAAQLQCEPLCRDDWSTLGELHVFHEGVIPASAYTIDVVDCSCDLADKSNYSPALSLTTSVLGDILEGLDIIPPGPPDGARNIVDVLGVLEKFSNTLKAPRKAVADIEPNCLDMTINISDVLRTVDGFVGGVYSFPPKVTDPCLSPCGNPVP